MYLKSIEVQGFKSFANKIVFTFHNGITGIVGPNGSGKSNVADAVRWVLGEQRSKQLRGESMQDVIFSGTELRKPLSSAYVAITFDNADHKLALEYDEVTVARRLYRSGESEYSINGSPCRLKDVNELFYDTGIGKEGYSIIGQGQIEKILSGKPDEKRELFDEAAGIVKFKKRKTTAQKKLEDEKGNLVRVADILSELERQVEPLEKQSEKARIYLKHKEELKELDVNMFLLDNKRLSEQLSDVTDKYGIAKEEYDKAAGEYEKIKEEYDSVGRRIEELEGEIESARNTLTDTSVMRGKLEGEINVLKERIKSAQANEKHFNERITSITEQIERVDSERAKGSEGREGLDRQVAELEAKRNQARDELSKVQGQIDDLNQSIENSKNRIIEMLGERATIKSRLGNSDTMLEQMRIKKAELNSRLLQAKSDEEQREAQWTALQAEFERINGEIASANADLKRMEEETGTFKSRLSKKDEEIRELQGAYQGYKSKLDAISNLTERYEGYGNSIQRVMEQKDKNEGIIGVVADIIEVDKEYEIAIETALGGSIQNIVTTDEEVAKQMISFLKKNRYGRATFLPLSSIKSQQEFKMTQILGENGVKGLANTLVRTDKRYENVAKSLLGRIVVVDNVDNAVRLAKKYNHSVRMVTLEGELLAQGGAISGGAYKNSSNLLGRRRELDELAKKVKETKEKLDRANRDIEDIKTQRNELRKNIEEAKARLQELFIEQNTARLNVAAIEEQKEQAREGFSSLSNEEQDITQRTKELGTDKEKIQAELEASENEEKQLDAKISKEQEKLEACRVEESERTAQANECEVEYEKLLQKQEFEQANIDRFEGELARFREELAQVQESLELSRADAEERKQSIEELEKTIEASHVTQADAEKALKEKQQQRDELSQQQKGFFAKREELSDKKNALDKEVYRLNAQREKLDEAIETQIEYMWSEYELTLVSAQSLRNEELTDLPAMKKRITEIKDSIRKLGDVNVNAIEDYKALMERYTFMKNQHDDLIEAQKTLEGIIDELDAAMRKQFAEKFEEIKREFDKVFKELFGGGKGTLELTEGEDVLEAGVRIIAQPPGKKLQNMMQLSGGEKSFTAIALLFAIQNLKPSPFCLLDEIEAALDEENVSRFAKYLNKLTKYTQFIVITHRRGTMEQADRLYGITMQEKGVSALVSVSLVDSEKWSAESKEEES